MVIVIKQVSTLKEKMELMEDKIVDKSKFQKREFKENIRAIEANKNIKIDPST